jgi:glutaredoxin
MFVIYTKPDCPFCDQAKALLESKGLPYELRHLDVGQPKVEGSIYIDREKFLAENPNVRTVPYIKDGDTVVGGFMELRSYLQRTEKTAQACSCQVQG